MTPAQAYAAAVDALQAARRRNREIRRACECYEAPEEATHDYPGSDGYPPCPWSKRPREDWCEACAGLTDIPRIGPLKDAQRAALRAVLAEGRSLAKVPRASGRMPVNLGPTPPSEVCEPLGLAHDGRQIDAVMAEKVTAEPRPLSTYTADEIRAFPVGTEIDDPKAPTEEARNLRYCVLTPDGWTHGEWYMGPALTMDEFIQWEVPRQPAALVHFPAKVTP